MAALFRPSITRHVGPDGKRCRKTDPQAKRQVTKSKTWFGRYRDADNILKTASLGTTVKSAAQTKLSELIRQARDQRAGVISPFQQHADKLLTEHLADFATHLEAKSCVPEHRQNVETQCRLIITECKFRYLRDLSASRVQVFLGNLKAAGKSVRTVNGHLQAVKQFCRWMVRDRRLLENPLQHLNGLNTKTDPRIVRRELTDDEIGRVLEHARTGPDRMGLSGWERFTLYATALGTGLRASELASLTPRSFDLTSDPPTVRIEAANEKARRGDTLPIGADLVRLLSPWLSELSRTAKLWPGPWAVQKRASRFLQADLKAARDQWIFEAPENSPERAARENSDFLTYRNHEGEQADFHALRHTYLSRLGRSGASAKVMQRLARHSTVELTLGRYTHASVYDLASAVDQLPGIPTTTTATHNPEILQATCTTDAGVSVTPKRAQRVSRSIGRRVG